MNKKINIHEVWCFEHMRWENINKDNCVYD